ncbi:MAG TPA: histidine phosphatase family protein [Chthoniobacterales bacterium]
MLIYLLRHADAAPLVTTDEARPLTKKGLHQAETVGEFCVKHEISPQAVITSPVLRAADTAKAVARRLPDAELITDTRLACGMEPETGFEVIREYSKFDTIVLVGHQPDFGDLVSSLLSNDASLAVNFRKAALIAIEVQSFSQGGGALEFFVPVRLMHG